ncbi:MAG: glycosyltransferase family 2 protein [Phycisphaeraceae bacterium]|nr:glycosyltransferase family 2 protein [Phycisphaeraceae bacterium]
MTTIPNPPRLRAPVNVDPLLPRPLASPNPANTRLVCVVSPNFNGPKDVQQLLHDLRALDLGTRSGGGALLELQAIVVDNASATPIADAVDVPDDLHVEFLRLTTNTGGAGGYSAGMARAIKRGRETGRMPEFVWLLDSDARPEPAALLALVKAMDAYPNYIVMGSAIANPDTGVVFEIGGFLDHFCGEWHPRWGEENPPPKRTVPVGYVAACSCMTRAEAIEKVGLFPDVFLKADDVEWSCRVAREMGGKVGATCDSVVTHPQWKFGETLPRYYIARNGFGAIDAMRLGARVRFFRALRELPRALAQVVIGRPDLAECHIRGLEDAAARKYWGPGAKDELVIDKFLPFEKLGEVLAPHIEQITDRRVWMHGRIRLGEQSARELAHQLEALGLDAPPIARGPFIMERERFFTGLRGGLWRLLRGPSHSIAVIPVRGRPNAWARGRIQIEVMPQGFVLRKFHRRTILRQIVSFGRRGLKAAVRIGLQHTGRTTAERLPTVDNYAYEVESIRTFEPARS